MAIVIIRSRDGRCEITHESLPGGVEYFDTDQFSAVKLDGSHCELRGDAPGGTSFQYADIPSPIRERLHHLGFYSAISDIARIIQRPMNAEPSAEPAGRRVASNHVASQTESSRARAKDNDPHMLAARKRCSLIPGIHRVGAMANPCAHCGPLRWGGEVARKSICCNAGMEQLRDIKDPPGPLLSLFNGARAYASDFQHIDRGCNALLSFASIGANIDAPTSTRGSYVYRIRGAMYRRFGPMEPEDGAAPR